MRSGVIMLVLLLHSFRFSKNRVDIISLELKIRKMEHEMQKSLMKRSKAETTPASEAAAEEADSESKAAAETRTELELPDPHAEIPEDTIRKVLEILSRAAAICSTRQELDFE